MLPCLEYLNSSELFLDHHSHTRPKNHSQTRHIDSVMNVDIRVAMAISLTVIILRWKSLLGKHCKLYNSSYLSLYLKFDCYCIFHSLIKQILYFLVWQRGSPSSSAAFGLNAPSMTPVQVFSNLMDSHFDPLPTPFWSESVTITMLFCQPSTSNKHDSINSKTTRIEGICLSIHPRQNHHSIFFYVCQ